MVQRLQNLPDGGTGLFLTIWDKGSSSVCFQWGRNKVQQENLQKFPAPHLCVSYYTEEVRECESAVVCSCLSSPAL